ncbi:MAG TPA: MFS transporter, partial [Candidatus Eisenbacteria bacterium]|nr:MFS transporter [Candidatus Eisenbacteria bacterium]
MFSPRKAETASSVPTMTPRVLAWALYDFASSVYPAVITATVFSVYFANVIVGNSTGRGDLWWGRVLSASMVFVALSSPLVGSIADRGGLRKRFLIAYSGLCIVAVALFATLSPGELAPAFALAVLANIGFEGALVFYNAYLNDIAPPGRHGFVSGFGFGLGYAGSAIGLLAVLPLVTKERFDLVWLTVAGMYAVFAIPSLLGLPPDAHTGASIRRAVMLGIRGFRGTLIEAWGIPKLRRFLLAYFVYIDGINTTVYFSSLFATKTLGFRAQELITLFLIVQLSALVGAFAWAKPTDRWGPKRVIMITLVLWVGVALAGFFVNSRHTFYAVAVVAGSGLGAVQAASRTLMAALIPQGKEAEMFGFYAFCGKSSSILGPLLFGGISYAFHGNQRFAVL